MLAPSERTLPAEKLHDPRVWNPARFDGDPSLQKFMVTRNVKKILK